MKWDAKVRNNPELYDNVLVNDSKEKMTKIYNVRKFE